MNAFKPSMLALMLSSFFLQAETDKAPAWDVNAPQGQFNDVNI